MRVDEKFKEMGNVLLHRALYKACFEPGFTLCKLLSELSTNSALLLADTTCSLLEFINKYIRLLDFSIASRPLKGENKKINLCYKIKYRKNKIIIRQ